MEISTRTVSSGTKKYVYHVLTSDKGEELLWNTHNPKTENTIYKEINLYWATLPKNRKAQIFSVYAKIREELDEQLNPSERHRVITNLTRDLMKLHPVEEMTNFLSNVSLTYPEKVTTPQDPSRDPRKTYDRYRYSKLLLLSMTLRIPGLYWPEYLSASSDYTSPRHLDSTAMRLLEKSWVVKSECYRDLCDYVAAITEKDDKTSIASVLEGVGSSMIPDWILSYLCVRVLSNRSLDGDGQSNNLIARVYQAIRTKMQDKERGASGFFKTKKPTGPASDENRALLEEYKIRTKLSEGDRAFLEAYSSEMITVAKHIDETIDPELVKQNWETDLQFRNYKTIPAQDRLLKMVVGPALPAKSTGVLEREFKHRLLSVARSVLVHWGFPYLAAFLLAEAVPPNGDNVAVNENRANFPSALKQRILELYPYSPDPKPLIRGNKENVVLRIISEIVGSLVENDWVVHAHPDLIQAIADQIVDDVYIAPGDLIRYLSELTIKIAERNS